MIGAIVLAAGQGKRLNCVDQNKVMLKLLGKPLIGYTYNILKKLNIKNIVIVVGFAKESVIKYFNNKVLFAVQKKPEGTGEATWAGLKKMPSNVDKVLVMYGDHSFFYTTEMIKGLINFQQKTNYPAVLITVERKEPFNYGRIIRNGKNTLSAIVEEKNADDKQKKIKEINPGFYLFDKKFLKKYLPRVKRNPVSNEFYLTDIVEIAVSDGVKIGAYKVYDENISVGVNTKEQLEEAEKLMKKNHVK
jgi:bifunctional N-acetylglucosamine-1-phosphate-uridyltransferase/glucosamine-1-phosphate-acetyltransferase GlmU-like protein